MEQLTHITLLSPETANHLQVSIIILIIMIMIIILVMMIMRIMMIMMIMIMLMIIIVMSPHFVFTGPGSVKDL